ncbi:hypothetical protein SLEP1_g6543 [Rubroshorea leprosula]|uniref:Uncharacterized protein n=1 Tax=Rubroshorea leprosula TaxID=152421 RepID=A0AAV5I6C0_9ROSI|nr:hypothetical protein SLEP1_g6543 [Rubroshorea leprosula]
MEAAKGLMYRLKFCNNFLAQGCVLNVKRLTMPIEEYPRLSPAPQLTIIITNWMHSFVMAPLDMVHLGLIVVEICN